MKEMNCSQCLLWMMSSRKSSSMWIGEMENTARYLMN